MRLKLIFATFLLVAACTTSAPTTTEPAPATTSTLAVSPSTTEAAPPSTTIPATTVPAPSTTTSTTSVTGRVVDLASPCGVIAEFVARSAEEDHRGAADLVHPLTTSGLPDDGFAGLDVSSEGFADELAMSVAPRQDDPDRTCTFVEFGMSLGERVGVVTLVGAVVIDQPAPVHTAAAWVVRTNRDRWLVDLLGVHASIASPLGTDPREGVRLGSPGDTFDWLVLFDGAVVTVERLDEAPDLALEWTPDDEIEAGPHWLTFASMLESGVVDAVAVAGVTP